MKTTYNLSCEYKIDYINEAITVSKKFLKAAGVYNSPEYKLMKELRADYPTFTFKEKKLPEFDENNKIVVTPKGHDAKSPKIAS